MDSGGDKDQDKKMIGANFVKSDLLGGEKPDLGQRFGRDYHPEARPSISVNTGFLVDPANSPTRARGASTIKRLEEGMEPRSSTFVAIDLYGQDRSEYLYSSLLQGLV